MKIALSSALLIGFVFAGCGHNPGGGADGHGPPPDMTFIFNFPDLPMADSGGGENNACGDQDPSCADHGFGPGAGQPFPLPTDKPQDPNVGGNGVSRDKN